MAAGHGPAGPDRVPLVDQDDLIDQLRLKEFRAPTGAESGDVPGPAGSAEGDGALRVDGDDPGAGREAAEVLRASHEGSGGARPDEQVVDRADLGEGGRGGARRVDTGVRLVPVLVGPQQVRIVGDQALDEGDPGAEVSAVGIPSVHHDHLGAQGLHGRHVLRRRVRIGDAREVVSLGGAHHAQGHAQVPRRRLDHPAAGAEETSELGVRDQSDGGLELDGTSRVQALDLEEQFAAGQFTGKTQEDVVRDDVIGIVVNGHARASLPGDVRVWSSVVMERVRRT